MKTDRHRLGWQKRSEQKTPQTWNQHLGETPTAAMEGLLECAALEHTKVTPHQTGISSPQYDIAQCDSSV